MAAPKGNKNRKMSGHGLYVRVRVPRPELKEIIEAMSPEERGQALADYLDNQASQSLIIVADCARCGEPINATEPALMWEGQRVCDSCHQIAMAAKEAQDAAVG